MAVNYNEQSKMVEFTATSCTISGSEGFSKLSIHVTAASTANASVTGISGTVGTLPTTAITLVPDQVLVLGRGNKPLDGVTITAPASCTVQVVGTLNINISY